jgi:hypothetical protein
MLQPRLHQRIALEAISVVEISVRVDGLNKKTLEVDGIQTLSTESSWPDTP